MFTQFDHETLRKYHTAFGSLFNGIVVVRKESDGDEAHRLVVPLEYSARDAWLARLRQDPTLGRPVAVVLPRLAYEMTGMRYDAARKLNSLHKRTRPTLLADDKTTRRYYSGTPYILSYALYIGSDTLEDANQIIGQILPYFSPDFTLTVKVLPTMGVNDRCRIMFDGDPQWEDNYQEEFARTRQVTVTLKFNVYATFYGPIASPKIIKEVTVDTHVISTGEVIAPQHLESEQFADFTLEDDSGRMLSETSPTDAIAAARVSRVHVVPDPSDQSDVVVTRTGYVDGKQYNSLTDEDEDSDVDHEQ